MVQLPKLYPTKRGEFFNMFKVSTCYSSFSHTYSSESESEQSTSHKNERDFLTNPYWIEDSDLKKGEVDFLSSAEIQFWKDLIDKYALHIFFFIM